MLSEMFFRRSKADEEMKRQEALASRNDRTFMQGLTQFGDKYSRYKGQQKKAHYAKYRQEERRELLRLKKQRKDLQEVLKRKQKGKDLDQKHVRILQQYGIRKNELNEDPEWLRRQTTRTFQSQKVRKIRDMRRERDREWGRVSKTLQDESKGLAA